MSKAYQRAGGVDLQAGYATVERIKKHVQRTHRPGVFGGLGGFGGLFDLAGLGYENPVLVAGADGVGTKIMIAFWPINMTRWALMRWPCALMMSWCRERSPPSFS